MANDQSQWLGHTTCRDYAYHVLGSGAQFFPLVLVWQHLKIIVSVLLCPRFISLFQQHYNSVRGPLNMQNSVNWRELLLLSVSPLRNLFRCSISTLSFSPWHYFTSLSDNAAVIRLDFSAFKPLLYPCTIAIINTALLSAKAHSHHWTHLMFTIKTIKYNPTLALFFPSRFSVQ